MSNKDRPVGLLQERCAESGLRNPAEPPSLSAFNDPAPSGNGTSLDIRPAQDQIEADRRRATLEQVFFGNNTRQERLRLLTDKPEMNAIDPTYVKRA